MPRYRIESDGKTTQVFDVETGVELDLPIVEVQWLHVIGEKPHIRLVLEAGELDVRLTAPGETEPQFLRGQ